MAREEMLIQIDGSYHRWLGEDGPQFTLLLAVNDATGCIVNALFCEKEPAVPAQKPCDAYDLQPTHQQIQPLGPPENSYSA